MVAETARHMRALPLCGEADRLGRGIDHLAGALDTAEAPNDFGFDLVPALVSRLHRLVFT